MQVTHLLTPRFAQRTANSGRQPHKVDRRDEFHCQVEIMYYRSVVGRRRQPYRRRHLLSRKQPPQTHGCLGLEEEEEAPQTRKDLRARTGAACAAPVEWARCGLCGEEAGFAVLDGVGSSFVSVDF